MGYSRILTGKWYTKESATLAATSFEMTYNKAYAGVTESVYSTKPYKYVGSSYVIGAVSQRVKQSWQRKAWGDKSGNLQAGGQGRCNNYMF